TNTATTYSETPSSAGTWDYRAVVKSGACLEAVSGIRTIIVQAPSVAGGTPTGGSSPVCLDSSIGTLSINNTPAVVGNVVRWERRRITAPAIGWTAIPSSANNTFTENANYGAGTWEYRVVVKNGQCTEAVSGGKQII